MSIAKIYLFTAEKIIYYDLKIKIFDCMENFFFFISNSFLSTFIDSIFRYDVGHM